MNDKGLEARITLETSVIGGSLSVSFAEETALQSLYDRYSSPESNRASTAHAALMGEWHRSRALIESYRGKTEQLRRLAAGGQQQEQAPVMHPTLQEIEANERFEAAARARDNAIQHPDVERQNQMRGAAHEILHLIYIAHAFDRDEIKGDETKAEESRTAISHLDGVRDGRSSFVFRGTYPMLTRAQLDEVARAVLEDEWPVEMGGI